MSDESTTAAGTGEEERADLQQIVSQIGNLPNALGLAGRLSSGVIDDAAALDMRTLHLVRVAALAATGAPKASWEINLELMEDEVSVDDIEAVLAAVAPIIGTSRYLEAVSTLVTD